MDTAVLLSNAHAYANVLPYKANRFLFLIESISLQW